ncbi:hypothetical protein M885DRAFT_86950 [Pelagophyceae sp. CCMP2097]|nr:hypothetical protein M885DRAFT_86950 [Pelagophyceae sp. CCMP2097]
MNSPGGVLMYDGDPTESEEKTASEYEMSQSHQQMNHLLSYTKQNFPKIATPAEVPRPRGLARQTSRGKAGHPTYTVPRTQAPVRKTFWSRATYTWLLLNIIVWLPLWLKLITIRRKAASTEWVTIYDTDVTVELNVSSFQDRSTECFVCDKSNAGTSGIAYPIMARVEDFRASEKISTASYVVLFASFDWESWYVVNKAGLLMGLSEGTQDVDMCVDHAVEDDDAIVKQDDDDDDDFEVVQTVTTKEIVRTTNAVDDWEGDDDQTVLKKELITEVETERVNETLLIIPDDPERARQSYCCLGNPGFVYIVACVTPNADLRSGKSFYEPIEGPPFEDRCISLTSQCDYACDSVADQPVKDTCVNGEIPRDLLLSDKVYGDSSKNKDKRHYDRHFQQESPRAFFLHTTFIFFITMTAVGTWISFLPGTGISEEVAIPSIGEVEEHMEAHGEEQKPLCLCAFSISAQEPRMMVLRNICGKLIAWVNHRKFTFMSSVNSRDIVNSRKAENSTLFDDDEDGGGSGSSMTTSTWPNRPPISNADKRGGSADESQYLNDLVEIVDIFQDEGHRVGAYALWDAFVDTVNNGDLQFVVLLAEKMSEMSASDDLLKGKKPDDPDVHLLLDDELRAFAAKPETGVVQENVDRLELSFACYDLLTALGHHFFWRADMKLDIVGFRTLASNPEAVIETCAPLTSHPFPGRLKIWHGRTAFPGTRAAALGDQPPRGREDGRHEPVRRGRGADGGAGHRQEGLEHVVGAVRRPGQDGVAKALRRDQVPHRAAALL